LVVRSKKRNNPSQFFEICQLKKKVLPGSRLAKAINIKGSLAPDVENCTYCMPSFIYLPQMTTRSNAPASPPHPGLQPGLKNAEYMKRWDKSGYITVLTSSKLQWGKAIPH
jgi:hypothetical protein